MAPVQPGGDDGSDEELGAVGVGARVGHGQRARGGVGERKVLVREFRAVNRLAAGPCPLREVAALQHEVGDDAVEDGALVGQVLAGLADALLACEGKKKMERRRGWLSERGERTARCARAQAGLADRAPPSFHHSPVHRARKFSTVLGTVLPYRPMTMRPEERKGIGYGEGA